MAIAVELENGQSARNTVLVGIGFASLAWWISLSYFRGETRKLSHIPTVGITFPLISYIGTITYLFNAKKLVDEGLRRWSGKMFKIPEMVQWRVVITDPRMAEEVVRASDSIMSAMAANDEACTQATYYTNQPQLMIIKLVQTKFTLGESITANPYHLPLLRNELRRALVEITPDIHEEINDAFDELIPPTEDWSTVKLTNAIMQIVCRASNLIFVGRPLCRNPDYVDLNVKFTIDVLTVGTILRAVPPFLRPLVNRLISNIPKRVEVALSHLRPIFDARRQEREEKCDKAEKTPDMINWLMDIAKGEETTDEALTMRILATNFGAIHTSSLSFMHAFYYLAAYPKFADILREEVDEVLDREGWTKTGLDQMERVDSFIKESQRMSPLSNVGSSRILLKDYTFYDGTTLPAGTSVVVCIHTAHFSEATYKEPHTFDPLRFVKLKEANPDKQYGIISSSPDSLAFGHGKHTCPGRFFAASELKLMLAYVVTTYDVRLEEEGVRPKDLWLMGSCMPNQRAKVFFRKRRASS